MIAVLIFFTFNFDQISIFFVIKLVSPKVAFQARKSPVEAKIPTGADHGGSMDVGLNGLIGSVGFQGQD